MTKFVLFLCVNLKSRNFYWGVLSILVLATVTATGSNSRRGHPRGTGKTERLIGNPYEYEEYPYTVNNSEQIESDGSLDIPSATTDEEVQPNEVPVKKCLSSLANQRTLADEHMDK
ncbi:MAG: hypothetical protein IPK68_00395 [Bdellovibrionales bacterium]|nr:hypothetical protein [Bdellovibrionales bacterium]